MTAKQLIIVTTSEWSRPLKLDASDARDALLHYSFGEQAWHLRIVYHSRLTIIVKPEQCYSDD